MQFLKYTFGILAAFFGLLFIASGIFMISQGYAAKAEVKAEIAAEKITIPIAQRPDGSVDEVVVDVVPEQYRGKLVVDAMTLNLQRKVILGHTLASTDGKRFSEMPRTLPKLDDAGTPVFDENGKPVMVPNTARDIWVTSTTLQTELMQAYLALKISDLVMGIGALVIALGAFVF